MNKILITGATGFVGARVARQLVEHGRDVALLLRETSNLSRIGDLLARCTVLRGDLGRLEPLRASIEQFAPQATIHMAWDGVKGAERNSPVHMQNVCNSLDLYRLARDAGADYFLGLGSQAEYGQMQGRIGEAAETRPTNCYGAAKLATALVLERTAAASDTGFAWLRLFSSYGPDDDPSWLIPYLIRRLLAAERPQVTAAEQVWDYIHVDDVASGIIATLDARARGIFNIGSGCGLPLRYVIEFIRDRIDPTLPIGFGEVAYRPDQVMHLEADISSLTTATGWSPKISLETGMSNLIDRYRQSSKTSAPSLTWREQSAVSRS